MSCTYEFVLFFFWGGGAKMVSILYSCIVHNCQISLGRGAKIVCFEYFFKRNNISINDLSFKL